MYDWTRDNVGRRRRRLRRGAVYGILLWMLIGTLNLSPIAFGVQRQYWLMNGLAIVVALAMIGKHTADYHRAGRMW